MGLFHTRAWLSLTCHISRVRQGFTLPLQQGYLLKVGLCGAVAKEMAVNSPSLQYYLGIGLAQLKAIELEVKMQISTAWFDSPCPNPLMESPNNVVGRTLEWDQSIDYKQRGCCNSFFKCIFYFFYHHQTNKTLILLIGKMLNIQ